MKIQNISRFKNKYCRIHFKRGSFNEGIFIHIPVMSSKYGYHRPGYFLRKDGYEDQKLEFAEIADIEIMEEDFPYCSHCNRITDPGCVESCDLFKMLTDKGGLCSK